MAKPRIPKTNPYAAFEDRVNEQAGALVSDALEAAGLTQAALARKLKWAPSYLSRMLNGEESIKLPVLVHLLAACGFELKLSRTAIKHDEPCCLEIW